MRKVILRMAIPLDGVVAPETKRRTCSSRGRGKKLFGPVVRIAPFGNSRPRACVRVSSALQDREPDLARADHGH